MIEDHLLSNQQMTNIKINKIIIKCGLGHGSEWMGKREEERRKSWTTTTDIGLNKGVEILQF